MPLSVVCPFCRGKLKISDDVVGKRVKCPKCHHSIRAQVNAGHHIIDASEPGKHQEANSDSGKNGLLVPAIMWLGGAAFVFLVLVIVLSILCKSVWMGLILAALLTVLGALLVGIPAAWIVLAKTAAIRDRQDERNLFFGMIKLVLWEANQGLVFLRNKRISKVIYGPRDGGGTRFIFPVVGDELRIRIPLTLRLTQFEDHEVLTRESTQLYVKVALWWRVADLERYYYSVDNKVDVKSTAQLAEVEELDVDERDVKRCKWMRRSNGCSRWQKAAYASSSPKPARRLWSQKRPPATCTSKKSIKQAWTTTRALIPALTRAETRPPRVSWRTKSAKCLTRKSRNTGWRSTGLRWKSSCNPGPLPRRKRAHLRFLETAGRVNEHPPPWGPGGAERVVAERRRA